MYFLLLLFMASIPLGLRLIPRKSNAGKAVVAAGLIGALVAGGVMLRRSGKPLPPVLGARSGEAVGWKLAGAVADAVPSGSTVLVLHWNGTDTDKLAALEAEATARGLIVVKETPPPEVKTGNSNDVMRISMEEASVPPYFLVTSARQHPEAKALVALLNFTGMIPDAWTKELPLLFLDERAERFANWRLLLPQGEVGAVVCHKPPTAWDALDALDADRQRLFDLRYDLMRAAP